MDATLSQLSPDALLRENAPFYNFNDWSNFDFEDVGVFKARIQWAWEETSTQYLGGAPWQDIQPSCQYDNGSRDSNVLEVFAETELYNIQDLQPWSSLSSPEDFFENQKQNISRSLQSPDREPPKPKQYTCDWLGCHKTSFDDVGEWKIHIREHARLARNSWRPEFRCSWSGCTSKALHKSTKAFEDHLNNIHINPLVCTVDGCRHKRPFRGKADLQRHLNCVHTEGSKAKCPYPKCMTQGRDFSRKDKLINHLREAHDTEPCPFVHCVVVLEPRLDSTAKHIAKLHGEFECALGSCKGLVSSFCENGLLEHLQLDHKMAWDMVLKARDMAQTAGDKTLRDEHVAFADVYTCRNCHDSVN